MRRSVFLIIVGVVASIVTPLTLANAATRTCPASPSGWLPFEILGAPGDPAPSPGDDPIWDHTEDLAAIEGLTMQDLAAVFGLPDEDALYANLLGFMIGADHNSDGTICIKGFPLQQDRYPAYIFGGQDNNARVPS